MKQIIGGRARRRRARKANGAGVALSYAGLPPSRFDFQRLGPGVLRVSGVELVAEVFCHNHAATELEILMNPLSSEIPRLVSISGGFEKFKFKRLRLHYTPGCPTTRTGVVHAAYIEDPLSRNPLGAIEFRAYEHSFVGSVGVPLSTTLEVEEEDQWYLIHPVSDSANLTEAFRDPTKRFQGKISLATGGSTVADENTLAGYVCLEYEVYMKDLRPARSMALSLSTTSGFSQTFTGGASASTNNVQWPLLNWASGEFGWQPSRGVRPDSLAREDESFWLEAATWVFDTFLALNEVEASTDGVVVRRPSGPKPKMLMRGDKYILLNVEAGTKFVSTRCVGIEKFGKLQRTTKALDGTVYHYWECGDVKGEVDADELWRHTQFAPMAAGDVTLTIVGQPVDENADLANEETISTSLFVLGTGAGVMEDVAPVTTTKDYIAYARVTPTGTEVRTSDPVPLLPLFTLARRGFVTDVA
jgi:hypothetical protein